MDSKNEMRWHFITKFSFRFFFIFFILVSWIWNFVPYYDQEIAGYFYAFADWIKRTFLNIHTRVPRPTGSGDTTDDWVLFGTFIVLSIAGGAIWSLLDRRRSNYQTLHVWLRVYLRYYVGVVMLSYGFYKVIPTQFPFPFQINLHTPVGDLTPMRLLWLMMGYSIPYNIFTGLAEVIGGALLFFRRTTTLGAVILLGAIGNVAMLNYSYDVPVKLFSGTLFMMTVLLLIPDMKRLGDFFVFNRPVAPREERPYFDSKNARRIRIALKTIVIGFFFYYSFNVPWQFFTRPTPKTKLYGTFDVTEFRLYKEGEILAVADSSIWRQLVFNQPFSDNRCVVLAKRQWSNDRLLCTFDSVESAMTLSFRADSTKNVKARFVATDSATYVVRGMMGRDSLFAQLRKNGKPFRLVTHGFHWVAETPW